MSEPQRARVDNVFFLGTGRCGTVTVTRACEHLTNFTAGHETLSRRLGDERFDYPLHHIEADNRLSWLLGELGARFDDSQVLYVHLLRDPDDVARSHVRRWDSPFRASIIRAFSHGVIKRSHEYTEREILQACEFYVRTVTTNIDEFLRSRPSMRIDIEGARGCFPEFLDRIGAEGDIGAALDELSYNHNASPPVAAADQAESNEPATSATSDDDVERLTTPQE